MPNTHQWAHRKVSETLNGKKQYGKRKLTEQGMSLDVCGNICLVYNLMRG
jgi:hypothetical protein